jgi:hypothetical protein
MVCRQGRLVRLDRRAAAVTSLRRLKQQVEAEVDRLAREERCWRIVLVVALLLSLGFIAADFLEVLP